MARVLGMGLLLAHPHWQHSAILGPVGATPIAARSSRNARLYYPERAARPPRWRSGERHRRYRPHPAPGACVWPVGLFISQTGASHGHTPPARAKPTQIKLAESPPRCCAFLCWVTVWCRVCAVVLARGALHASSWLNSWPPLALTWGPGATIGVDVGL